MTEQQKLPPVLSPDAIAEGIARDAQKLDGYEVVSVSPMFTDEMFGMQMLHCYAVLPANGGRDFSSIAVTLAMADEPFLAEVNRTALIHALQHYFGRVQIFGNALAFAKYCDKQWPAEQFNKVVSNIMRERGLN